MCLVHFRHVDLLLLLCKIHRIHGRRGHISFNIETYVAKPFLSTLESGIDVGQGITVRPGKFVKKNKRRALNKRRA